MNKIIKIPHPGVILNLEFLRPLQISQYKLAKDINVSPIRISEIVKGTRAISPDTAIRFGIYFNTTEMFWLNLQAQFDLKMEKLRKKSSILSIKKYTFCAPKKNAVSRIFS